MGVHVRLALENSESLDWMLKGTKFDTTTCLPLCKIKDEGIPEDHMECSWVVSFIRKVKSTTTTNQALRTSSTLV
eukprot:scaffold41450_cov161-Skeletonema_marinoi.AAC.1